MAVAAYASMTDQLKPDSTKSGFNADNMSFGGANATIVAASLLAPGTSKLLLDMTGNKIEAQAVLTHSDGATEFCITGIYSPTTANTTIQHAIVRQVLGATTNGFNIRVATILGACVLQIYYDNNKIGADSAALTLGNKYRFGLYVKQGTLGSANSTIKFYLDDVTSGTDIAVGAATNVVSSTVVNMTNAPTSVATIFGNTSGAGGWAIKHEFQHLVIITVTGATNNRPDLRVLDPICVTKRSVPVALGNYNTWTVGTAGNLTQIPPDDATTVISQAFVGGVPAARTNSYTITPWATVGNSNGDTALAARCSIRCSAITIAQHEILFRSGATDTFAGSFTGTAWTTSIYTGAFSLPIQQVDPNTSAAWALSAYDAVEVGVRGSWTVADGTARCTWMGVDAVFVRGAALASTTRNSVMMF